MKNPLVKFFIFLFLIMSLEFAHSNENKKQLYYLGAGGEPKGDSTIFDAQASKVGDFVNSSEWETTVSFNGGHEDTEKIINKKFKKARNVGSFTEYKYDKIIADITKKLESGELKANDQLMIVIDTHGFKNNGEKTHKWALAIPDMKEVEEYLSGGMSKEDQVKYLGGKGLVSADQMEKLAVLASEKGVKLAIVDHSCFSGNLLNIKNDKVCMISGAGKNQVSYIQPKVFGMIIPMTYIGNFYGSMKPGVNLEDLFLSSRTQGIDLIDFPMISTEEGRAINDLIYSYLSPYLEFAEDDVKKYDVKDQNIFAQQACFASEKHDSFILELKLQKIIAGAAKKMPLKEFDALEKALNKYRAHQVETEKVYNQMFDIDKDLEKILLSATLEEKEFLESWNHRDFILNDWDKVYVKTNITEQFGSKFEADTLAEIQINLKTIRKKQAYANSVIAKLSKTQQQNIKKFQSVYAKDDEAFKLAGKVGTEAKKVYDILYKNMQRKDKSNPCRDFIL